jgi:putative heme iron utilization protein
MLSFVIILLTSIVLYIVPQGRIAYWADWRLWGLTKEQWTNIHMINGLLFLLSIFLHIYYNWTPIMTYLKNKTREMKVFTKEFNVALVLTLIFTVGTLLGVPPFQWVLNVGEDIKDAAAEKYGEPPYGHAELSTLRTFAKKQGFDLADSMAQLKKAGIRVDNEKQTLKDVARLNRTSPQQVYLAMTPETPPDAAKKFPENPPSGFGKRVLADLCREYNLDIEAVERRLAENGMTATADMTVKAIAEKHNTGPMDIFDILKQSAESAATTAAHAAGENKGTGGGGAQKPVGLGKMTIAQVCSNYQLDQTAVLKKLADSGITASPDEKMKKVADKHNTTPFDLFETMKEI